MYQLYQRKSNQINTQAKLWQQLCWLGRRQSKNKTKKTNRNLFTLGFYNCTLSSTKQFHMWICYDVKTRRHFVLFIMDILARCKNYLLHGSRFYTFIKFYHFMHATVCIESFGSIGLVLVMAHALSTLAQTNNFCASILVTLIQSV